MLPIPRALEFTILTAARISEVVNAAWDEFDLKGKTWTVPGARMKAGRPHRVPLSDPAIAVLNKMQAKEQPGGYVFPGWKTGRPLTGIACLKLLKEDMKRDGFTVHGFRSSFRDWAAEQTNYPREIAEAALAHVISDKTEAAYRRGDLFEKRAKMMADWAKYCAKVQSGDVTPIRGRTKIS